MQTIWKVYIKFRKFTDNLGTFLTISKLTRQSGKLTVSLENFQTIWKNYVEFTDKLETFQTTWNVFRQPLKFPDNLKTFQAI